MSRLCWCGKWTVHYGEFWFVYWEPQLDDDATDWVPHPVVVVPTSMTLWLEGWTTHPQPVIGKRNKMMRWWCTGRRGRRMSNHKANEWYYVYNQSVSRSVAVCSLHWAHAVWLWLTELRCRTEALCFFFFWWWWPRGRGLRIVMRFSVYLRRECDLVLVFIRSSFELLGRSGQQSSEWVGPGGAVEEKSIRSQIPINWRNVMEYLIYESGSERLNERT